MPLRALTLLLTVSAALAACDGGTTADAVITGDLVGQFRARPAFEPLAAALTLTGVGRELDGGPFTVFAPTEAALRYVGTDFSPVLFAEPQRAILARVLRHHVVAGRLAPEALTDGATFTALDGATLTVRRIGPVVTVNGTTVEVARAVEADNGVAYPVADVLLDGIAAEDRVRLSPSLSVLAQGLRATPVAEIATLPQKTVLAPINDAFTGLGGASLSLLQDSANRDVFARLLRTLVLAGDVDLAARVGGTVTTIAGDVLPVTRDADGVLSVEGVRVLHAETTADGRFYVLAEPVFAGLTLSQRLRIRTDLAQFLAGTPLVPGLPELLAGRSTEVTVFGPVDAAYAARSSNTRQTLDAPAQAALLRRATGVHVVRGRYAPADLTNGLQLTALDGTVLTVRRNLDAISLDDTPVRAPVRLANGFLYTVDGFVLPDVDLLDTVLLAGFPEYFLTVRRAGVEAEFRARAHTAFVLDDADIGPLVQRPTAEIRTLLRRTATAAYIPAFTGLLPLTFEALNGDARTIERTMCPAQDPTCRPYVIDPFVTASGVRVERPKFSAGQRTQSRTGAWHKLYEPEFRLVQGVNERGAGLP